MTHVPIKLVYWGTLSELALSFPSLYLYIFDCSKVIRVEDKGYGFFNLDEVVGDEAEEVSPVQHWRVGVAVNN